MDKYHILSRKGEGTFAQVVKAQRVDNGKFYAIKCMKSSFRNWEKVNALQEIQSLKRLMPHPNIVNMTEVLYESNTGRLALVFELMDANLYDIIKDRKRPLSNPVVKSYGYQILNALSYVHQKGLFHRDVKPENILVVRNAKVLKLADFGSVRRIDTKPPYTEYISTRWYRPPECLLTDGLYGPKMDVWAAGCVIFEILSLKALFPGKDEVDQIYRINKVLGSPTLKDWLALKKHGSQICKKIDFKYQRGTGFNHYIPNATDDCISLLQLMLIYNSEDRISAAGALSHQFFHDAIVPGYRPSATASSTVSGSSKRSDRSNPSQKKQTWESPMRKLHKHGPSPYKNQQNANAPKSTKTAKSPVRISPLDDDERDKARKPSNGSKSESLHSKQCAYLTQNVNNGPGTITRLKDVTTKADEKPFKAPPKKKVELPRIRVDNYGKGVLPAISGPSVPKMSQQVGSTTATWHMNHNYATRSQISKKMTYAIPFASHATGTDGPTFGDQTGVNGPLAGASSYSTSFARRRQRNKKIFASVSSSGYGRTSYVPTQNPNMATNNRLGADTTVNSFHSPKNLYPRRSRITPLDSQVSPNRHNALPTNSMGQSKKSGTIISKLDRLQF